MNSTGYEIRHALLNEARDMLFQDWLMKRDVVFNNAHVEKRTILETEVPLAPSFDAILKLAQQMNEFVSHSDK